jgi:protein PhnA
MPDMSDDEYVYDEDSGEWMTAADLAAKRAAESSIEVRDAVGNLLADGDQVTLIKDLDVKGAGQTLKRGTLIKSIRLTGDPQEIDCKFDGIKGLVLRAEFVRKALTRHRTAAYGGAAPPTALPPPHPVFRTRFWQRLSPIRSCFR